jgi:hypothetical protein
VAAAFVAVVLRERHQVRFLLDVEAQAFGDRLQQHLPIDKPGRARHSGAGEDGRVFLLDLLGKDAQKRLDIQIGHAVLRPPPSR